MALFSNYKDQAVNDATGGSKYSQLADNARQNSSNNYPSNPVNNTTKSKPKIGGALGSFANENNLQMYSPSSSSGGSNLTKIDMDAINAQRQAEERARQEELRRLEEERRMREEQERIAQEARQAAVDTAQAEAEERREQPSSSYMPYGDPRQNTDNPLVAPQRIRGLASELPNPEPEMLFPTDYGGTTIGEKTWTPALTPVENPQDTRKGFASKVGTSAEDEDDFTEFYTGPSTEETTPAPITNPLSYRMDIPGLPGVGPNITVNPLELGVQNAIHEYNNSDNPLTEWLGRSYPAYTGNNDARQPYAGFYRGRELMQPQAMPQTKSRPFSLNATPDYDRTLEFLNNHYPLPTEAEVSGKTRGDYIAEAIEMGLPDPEAYADGMMESQNSTPMTNEDIAKQLVGIEESGRMIDQAAALPFRIAGKALEAAGQNYRNAMDNFTLNEPILHQPNLSTEGNNQPETTNPTYTDNILNSYANATGRALEDMDESDYRAMRDLNREATAVADQARFNALANGDVRNIPPQDLVGMLGKMTDPTYAQELEQQYQRFKDLGMNDRQISAELYRRAAEHMNPLARATDAQGNLHYDFALAGSGALPEDMAVPVVDEYGNGNAAFNEFANSVDYYDKNGNTIYRNPDGTFTEAVPKSDGTVEYRKYSGNPEEITSTYHYTPDQVLSMYVNPNGGRNGEPTWRGLDAVFEGLTPEERAGMEELLANFVGGGDLNRLRDGFDRETTGLTDEQYERLAQMFLNRMPAIQNLIDRGVLSERDVANFFFKAPSGSGSGSGSGTGTGSGYSRRSYSGYGGYGGYGYSRGGYSNGGYNYGGNNRTAQSNPSATTQRQNRVYNIMKNWSF